MGNQGLNENYVYAVQESEAQNPGETPVFRHPESQGKDLWKEYGNKTLQDLFRPRFIDRANEVGFRHRLFDKASKALTNEVREITNGEFKTMGEVFGSGLLNLDLVPEITDTGALPMKFVGVYAKNCLEYLTLDLACVFYGLTIIPIYDTLGEEATMFAFEQTAMGVCVMTANHLQGILKLKQKGGFGSLKTIVVIDPEAAQEATVKALESSGIRIVKWGEVVEAGQGKILPWAKVSPKSITAFSYTSGTTGQPKGAMLSHESLSAMCQTIAYVVQPLQPGDCYLSYLPMAHVMEKAIISTALTTSVIICMFSGDTNKLKEDLSIFKPTLFVSVPRLYNRFYDSIMKEIGKKGYAARFMFRRAVNSKKRWLYHNCSYHSKVFDKLIFNKLKEALGGRVRLMVSGSAPISVEVLDFLKVSFGAPLIEGYGQTEGAALEFITRTDDPEPGHVGGPGLSNEYKLVDIPEMNYTSKDTDDNGNPTPRGEIWVRGPNIIPGYYKLEEKNKETFTSDGWLKSGDIGMIYSEKRRLKIIDRKKNLFKLSQGEYIAPERLENIYKHAHSGISSVYVYGDSLKSCLVGVLNFDSRQLAGLAKEAGSQEEDPKKQAQDPAVKKKLLEILAAHGKKEGLNSLEMLRDIVIETTPFSDLKLLTEAFKLKRGEAKDYYKKQFDEMYAKLQ